MPRDLTNLAGAETADDQFIVQLIEIMLPTPWRATTLDAPVFFNLTDQTTAQLVAGGGLTQFSPKADLLIPRLTETIEDQLDSIDVTVSNHDAYWFQRLVAGDFRLVTARIWEGRISLALAQHPDSATFVGHVLTWEGVLTTIAANKEAATLTIEREEDHRRMRYPRQFYTSPLFKRCPAPESEILWGYTSRRV